MNAEIEPYLDESLESFLLRLSQYRGYERFAYFAEDIWQNTLFQHEATPGAFPFELNRVNVYHAQTTSQMRLRVLLDLENQLKLGKFQLLQIALSHSKATFSPDYRAVHRQGIDYPLLFIRNQSTPVCPQCLAEAPYIRQYWHFMPGKACPKHHCKLVERCPECGKLLDYQSTESIGHCECGFSLAKTTPVKAEISELKAAQWLNGEAIDEPGVMGLPLTISARYGFLLWYLGQLELSEISFEHFLAYCSTWPQQFDAELEKRTKHADAIRVKSWNKLFFSEVFGTFLKNSRQLPNSLLSQNIVLAEIFQYLMRLVSKHPRSKHANIGDILLSSLEASAILGCSTKEVARLYQFGELKAQINLKLHHNLSKYDSVFSLRDVVELRLAQMNCESDGLQNYLLEW